MISLTLDGVAASRPPDAGGDDHRAVSAGAESDEKAADVAEHERQFAAERRRLLAVFEEQLAEVRRDARESLAVAVRDAHATATAAAEERLAAEIARVWDDALREGQSAAAAAERRRTDALTRLSARVLRLVTDQLVAAQADDERRRELGAAALQALATLEADLAQAASERMHQVESMQALVNQVLEEEIRQGPPNPGGDTEPAGH